MLAPPLTTAPALPLEVPYYLSTSLVAEWLELSHEAGALFAGLVLMDTPHVSKAAKAVEPLTVPLAVLAPSPCGSTSPPPPSLPPSPQPPSLWWRARCVLPRGGWSRVRRGPSYVFFLFAFQLTPLLLFAASSGGGGGQALFGGMYLASLGMIMSPSFLLHHLSLIMAYVAAIYLLKVCNSAPSIGSQAHWRQGGSAAAPGEPWHCCASLVPH